jgi:hypothetical protein
MNAPFTSSLLSVDSASWISLGHSVAFLNHYIITRTKRVKETKSKDPAAAIKGSQHADVWLLQICDWKILHLVTSYLQPCLPKKDET